MTTPHSEQYRQVQDAKAELLQKQTESRTAGISQSAPACTLRTCCAICGAVCGKPWSDKAKEVCYRGCFWILAGHIGWNGGRQRIKFFTAAAVPLLAKYHTYDKLMKAGKELSPTLENVGVGVSLTKEHNTYAL